MTNMTRIANTTTLIWTSMHRHSGQICGKSDIVEEQTQTRELKATLLGSDIHSSDFTSAQYLYSTPSDIWCRQMCSRRISGINRYRELQSEYRTRWWMAAEGNIQLIGISEVGVTWAGGHIGHWTWGTPRNWTWATPFPPHLVPYLFVCLCS